MKDIEEEYQKLREELKAIPTKPVKQFFTEQSDDMIENYTPLYEHFQNFPGKSEMPSRFYDYPPREQEAILALFRARRSTYEPLLEKYGDDITPAFSRVTAALTYRGGPQKAPVKVCITGAAGALGYALIFRIACGSVFGPNTPVILSLLEVPSVLPRLQGVVMELEDCAFPLVKEIIATDSPVTAFSGVDYALLVGAKPRSKGMERGDLLAANAAIFSEQGRALNHAKGAGTRVLVVGNPANTNAYIASHFATSIPKENFSAMMRLDHNRGLTQLAQKLNCTLSDIDRFIIWGNHSATQFPDITHATIRGKWATEVITDTKWLEGAFYPTVQKRGAAILEARGSSSAASAASAAGDAVADWHFGTNGRWTSAAVCSKGEYGVEPGLFYSYPVVYNSDREWDIVRNLPITESAAAYMEATHQELLKEKEDVAAFLQSQ